MSSKSSIKPQIKGQTSLFSFFKKPVESPSGSVNPPTVTPSVVNNHHDSSNTTVKNSNYVGQSIREQSDTCTLSTSKTNQMSYGGIESIALMSANCSTKKNFTSSPSKRKPEVVNLDRGQSHEMNRNEEEEEEEGAVFKKKLDGFTNKKLRKSLVIEDEEEWNPNDSHNEISDDLMNWLDGEDEKDDDDNNNLDDGTNLTMKKEKSKWSGKSDSGRLHKGVTTGLVSSKPPLPKTIKSVQSTNGGDSSNENHDHNRNHNHSTSPGVKGKAVLSYSSTPVASHESTSYKYVTPSPNTSSIISQDSEISYSNQSLTEYGSPTQGSVISGSSTAGAIILPEGVIGRGSHEHNFFDFLKPQNRRDKAGKRINDPDYNPRTLFIPNEFMKDQTPAMFQWWQFKSENMDTVFFFKVGKFYELFHMDADIGMAELDLIYMKGTKAHSGFPEVSYGKFASILVSKGYRVARVEQTETPEMLKERNDSSGKKKDKVVRRELCSIMSKGTRTYCHLDDLSLLLDGDDSSNTMSESVLISITERISSSNKTNNTADGRVDNDNEEGKDEETIEYGVCCIDTVLGNVIIGQFQDDKQRCRLRTFLSRHNPSEILLHEDMRTINTDRVSDLAVLNTIRLLSPKALVTYIPRKDFPSTSTTLNMIQSSRYYSSNINSNAMSMILQDSVYGSSTTAIATSASASTSSTTSDLYDCYPSILKAAISGLSNGSSDLLMKALGGCILHLKRSLIDYEIFSMGKVYAYVPPDEEQVKNNDISLSDYTKSSFTNPSHTENNNSSEDTIKSSMTIDVIALTNLEILVNNYDHSEKGSLFAFLNRCKTSFGKRLLKSWICHPLYRPKDIKYRSLAIEEFLINPTLSSSDTINHLLSLLKGIPDLERLLSRIHSNSLSSKCNDFQDHPDTRAVMYESQIYNLRKIKDFADILFGFESLVKIGYLFKSIHETNPIQSKLLLQITQKNSSSNTSGSGNSKGKFQYDEMEKLLRYYRDIFDEKQAKKDGYIRPKHGVNESYDMAKDEVKSLEEEFETYLKEIKKQTNINDIKYFGSNKDRYQLEIPMNMTSKIPSNWTTKSQKKTHRRYWSPWIEKQLEKLIMAEDKLIVAQNDTIRKIFAKFDEKYNLWLDAVTCCATLDTIYSLSEVSKSSGYVWPEIELRNEQSGAYFHVENGRHPMLEHAMALRGDSSGYIPNSVTLGGQLTDYDEPKYIPKLLLLTGPNMGGKSTLLRQTCLLTIMAQIGCKVPADSCKMTCVDRIFTRVGASDKILSGQSTFFVELSETAMILKYATEDSICILDELGRGTATFDGTAIAHAVIDYLVKHNRSRVMFATHYHSLIDDWEMDPRIQLGHMDCVVQVSQMDMNIDTRDQVDAEVTFLYKLCDGSSPRSYGINVAKLAKLPSEVIEIAIKQSLEFESRMKKLESNVSTKLQNYRILQTYFERLVSIVNSEMSTPELAYAAIEIWNRFKSAVRLTEF